MTRVLLVERSFEWWAKRSEAEPDLPITADRPDEWTDTMIAVGTEAAVRAALARVAAGETTPVQECAGVGRTCPEVRAHRPAPGTLVRPGRSKPGDTLPAVWSAYS